MTTVHEDLSSLPKDSQLFDEIAHQLTQLIGVVVTVQAVWDWVKGERTPVINAEYLKTAIERAEETVKEGPGLQ